MDTIKVSEFAALKECGKQKYDILRLSLKSAKTDMVLLESKGWTMLADALKNRKTIRNEILNFVEQAVNRDWYQFDVQYNAAKNKLFSQLFRMGDYLENYIGDSQILSSNWNYQFPLMAKYRGVTIANVSGVVNLILKRKNGIEGIIFSSGMPVESVQARKPENKPENSLEITCAYAGLSTLYKDVPIKISKFYLKSKDDKGTTYAPYEERPGKNVISVDFYNDDARAKIAFASRYYSTGDCNNCRLRSSCKLSSKIRFDTAKHDENTPAASSIKLSEAQKSVISFVDGYMNVEAVPGAGKTFCLVKRLEHLIESGVKPGNILMVTFTKKACMEIKNRVSAALGTEKPEELPLIQTFNGLGYSILRENSDYLGGTVKLASNVDKKSFIVRALKECADEGIFIGNVNYSDLYSKYGLVSMVFKWFDSIESIGEHAFIENNANKDTKNILEVYSRYCKLAHDDMFIDYDDQIEMVNEMFTRNPFMSLKYIDRFKYIMVDEYQDINEAQFEMIRLLAGSGNLMVVGDCDQSIYKFRGGNPEFSLKFCEYFPGAKTVFMTDNYRSTEQIVSAANSLISYNTNRYAKKIKAHKTGSMPVSLYRGLPEGGLQTLVSNLEKQYLPGEIAVLSRNNNTLNRFGLSIAPDGSLESKDYIIEDNMFKGIYTCMELYYSGINDDEALYRALIYAGAERSEIKRKNCSVSLYDDLVGQGAIPDFKSQQPGMKTGDTLWNAGVRIGLCFTNLSLPLDIPQALDCLGMSLYGIKQHPVLSVLSEIADERNILKPYDLYTHMTNMIMFSDTTRVGYGECDERINLLTTHDSKGKEFKCVVLYGVDEFEPDEEERRLLYVGLTRAKETLIVVQNSVSMNMVEEFSCCCRVLDMTEVKKGVASYGN